MAEKIRLSNTEVTNSLDAIRTLLLSNQKLPIGLSTVCYDNLEVLSDQDDEVEEYRQELIDEHAEFDENGEVKTVEQDEDDANSQENGRQSAEIKFKSDQDKEAFVDKLSEKYDEENTLELKKVSRDLIEDVEAPPQVVPALRWMFDDDE